jgi:formylglycine-generating enzyme
MKPAIRRRRARTPALSPIVSIVSLALALPFAMGGLASCLTSGSLPAVDAGPYGFDSSVDSTVEFDSGSRVDSTTAADSATALDSATPIDSTTATDSAPQADSATGIDAEAERDAEGPDAEAGTDVGEDAGAPADAGADAADATPFCEGTCGSPSCGNCPDAATIANYDSFQAKNFNLDADEVTNATYAAFLAVNVDPASQPVFCAWNASFVPTAGWPATGKDDYPVAYVDWCDAFAYCAWAGRRLCGNIGGGPTAGAYRTNGDQSQWFRGCTGAKGGSSSAGYIQYPYADTYDASACNGGGYGAGAPVPVGSATNCVGGLPGLFDMSGNVSEWEDSCGDLDRSDAGPDAGPISNCAERGGSFEDDAGALECTASVVAARTTTAVNVGFRCCSP